MSAPISDNAAPLPGRPVNMRPDRVSMFQAMVTILGVVGISLVVLITGLVASVSGDELLMLVLAMAMTIIFTIPILLDRARAPADRHMLLSLCALGHWAYFVIPVFTQYFLLDIHVDGGLRLKNQPPSNIVAAQVVVLVGVMSMFAGYFYPASGALGRVMPKPVFDWPHSSALMVAVVMVSAGWFVTLGSQFGLVPRSFGSGALGAVASGTYFGVGLLAIIHAKFKSKPALVLIYLLIPPAMAIAFLTGSKRFMLAPIMVAALGYYIANRRMDTRWIVAGGLLLMVIYPVAQFWRDVVLAGNQLGMVDVLARPGRAVSLISAFLANADLSMHFEQGLQSATARIDALGVVTRIVTDTPGRVPFQGGWTLAYVPISFVPRIIWPDKPVIMVGQWITDNYGGGPAIRSNTGSAWIGELWFNFGYPGVIVGMGVIGAYFRILHEAFFRVFTVPACLSCLVILWATCTTIEMNLIAPFNGVIFNLMGPILIAHLGVRLFGGARPLKEEDPPPRPSGTAEPGSARN
ncbi:MAG: O-antigen polymerase [Myxococcota bacterium]|nr:O-antigen polymerase [Myxococcota bacterium]